MFATPTLAARIDRAEGRLCAAIVRAVAEREPEHAPFTVEIGAGVAVFAGPGSPSNKMIGVGFDGVPDEAELAAVERRFAAAGATLQAEVSTLAAPALHALLVRRGYEPHGFENVLGRPLGLPIPPLASHVVVERVDDLARWVDLVVEGFLHADLGGVGGDAMPPRDALVRWSSLTAALPGFVAYAARLGDDMVGGAALRLDGGIAQLCGASTLPQWRRRGVQTSLLRARLADAASQGSDLAVVTTEPGSRSQENVQREGFELLYARQLLVKTP